MHRPPQATEKSLGINNWIHTQQIAPSNSWNILESQIQLLCWLCNWASSSTEKRDNKKRKLDRPGMAKTKITRIAFFWSWNPSYLTIWWGLGRTIRFLPTPFPNLDTLNFLKLNCLQLRFNDLKIFYGFNELNCLHSLLRIKKLIPSKNQDLKDYLVKEGKIRFTFSSSMKQRLQRSSLNPFTKQKLVIKMRCISRKKYLRYQGVWNLPLLSLNIYTNRCCGRYCWIDYRTECSDQLQQHFQGYT